MRYFHFLLFAALLSAAWTAAAFSFNAYDLGFQGLYPCQRFHSVDFEAPKPKITKWDPRCDGGGKLLLTPRGPLVRGKARGPVMLDARGELVWMEDEEFEQAMNLNVQSYNGEDYLTFWTKGTKIKKSGKEHSDKSYVLLNSSYEVAYRIRPHGKGLRGDSHEFHITPQGTALITIYHKHVADCTELGLGTRCWIQDGLFQEIDIETGVLIFEWRATDHIRMTDVFSSPSRKDGHGKSKADAFDFFHINSVDKMDSGDYIISARYMHAIVCISGKTGEILWQVGGKNNRFEDVNGATNFAWQHHVTWQGNNTISVFDNHANSVLHSPSEYSQGMILHLDMENMTVTLLGKYVHPDKILNVSQGSVQVLPESGNVLVGFGNSPTYVEYAADGEVLCAAHFAPHLLFELVDFGLVKSYRVFKRPWVGRPKTVPNLKVEGGKVYVSWNGATEVSGWRLETAKARDNEFATVQEVERDGFETSFTLDKKVDGRVRVVALDAAKVILAHSAAVSIHERSSVLHLATRLSLFGFVVFMFGFAGFQILSRRFPGSLRLRGTVRLIKLSELKASVRTAVMGNDEYDSEDSEASPLLLGERDRVVDGRIGTLLGRFRRFDFRRRRLMI